MAGGLAGRHRGVEMFRERAELKPARAEAVE
jgi:hypothetical protein